MSWDWITPLSIIASIASIIGLFITFYQIRQDNKKKGKYTISLSSANGKTWQLKFFYAALAVSIFATIGSYLLQNPDETAIQHYYKQGPIVLGDNDDSCYYDRCIIIFKNRKISQSNPTEGEGSEVRWSFIIRNTTNETNATTLNTTMKRDHGER
jgi:hypothetical protein